MREPSWGCFGEMCRDAAKGGWPLAVHALWPASAVFGLVW
jgi:hypothetical protein